MNRKSFLIAEFSLAIIQIVDLNDHLEHRGLDRMRSHGEDGFERTVALAVLTVNLHRIGLLLQHREREILRRRKKARLRAA